MVKFWIFLGLVEDLLKNNLSLDSSYPPGDLKDLNFLVKKKPKIYPIFEMPGLPITT